MYFINEKYDVSGFNDLVDHGLYSFLKFAAVFASGDCRRHVKRDDALSAERFGHRAGCDALSKSFRDRGFADSRFSYQTGIVFRTARQDLNYTAELGFASDERIKLVFLCQSGEVAPEFIESGCFCVFFLRFCVCFACVGSSI
ncbi:hypothetical protein SDC9_79034 [bioreactor metagenome]|uniref:Uncharacterized protein n=1 Tax=bioreactor metagenome TaxID=1076179 RepID=A0A644YVH0_9ZZZZ